MEGCGDRIKACPVGRVSTTDVIAAGRSMMKKRKSGTHRVMAGLFLELAWSLPVLSHCQSHRGQLSRTSVGS